MPAAAGAALPSGLRDDRRPDAPACALRRTPQPRFVQNLAVPGAEIGDALDALNNPNPADFFNRLQTFILGGRSMVHAMIAGAPVAGHGGARLRTTRSGP